MRRPEEWPKPTDIEQWCEHCFRFGHKTGACLRKRSESMVKGLRVMYFMVGVLMIMPIKIFLYYSILKAINADRLLWFLFYAYIPMSIVATILEKIISSITEHKE